MVKSTDLPRLSAAWWQDNAPKDLAKTGFDRLLKAYEEAKKTAYKLGEFEHWADAGKALMAVEKKLPELARACGRVDTDLAAVVGRYPPVISGERKELKLQLERAHQRRKETGEAYLREKVARSLLAQIEGELKTVKSHRDAVDKAEHDVAALHAAAQKAASQKATVKAAEQAIRTHKDVVAKLKQSVGLCNAWQKSDTWRNIKNGTTAMAPTDLKSFKAKLAQMLDHVSAMEGRRRTIEAHQQALTRLAAGT